MKIHEPQKHYFVLFMNLKNLVVLLQRRKNVTTALHIIDSLNQSPQQIPIKITEAQLNTYHS